MPIRLDRGEHRHTILARRNAAPVLEDQHRYEQSLCSYLNDVSTHHIGGAKGVETLSTNGVTRGNAEFPYAKRREMTSRDLRIHRTVLTPSAPRSPFRRDSKQCLWLVRQPYHRAATLAAIWSAIFNAESAGLALHVLMSIMTLFLSASARPQPQPGALAFC